MLIINLTDDFINDNTINNIEKEIKANLINKKILKDWIDDNYIINKKIISIDTVRDIFKYSTDEEVENKIILFLEKNNLILKKEETKYYNFTNIFKKIKKYEPIILVTDTSDLNKINYITKFSNKLLVVNHKGERYYV